MTYTQEDIKRLLLKKLVVFGYFSTAADYTGDNDDITTKSYLWGQTELLFALLGDSDLKKSVEAINAYQEGVAKFESNESLSYSVAYEVKF